MNGQGSKHCADFSPPSTVTLVHARTHTWCAQTAEHTWIRALGVNIQMMLRSNAAEKKSTKGNVGTAAASMRLKDTKKADNRLQLMNGKTKKKL